jgi:excisionase family DNA binding protein
MTKCTSRKLDSSVLDELRRIRKLLEHRAASGSQSVAERLLTVNQTAAYLACSVWAVRELHWSHKLRGVMIGRRILFDRSDVDTYVDALKRASRFRSVDIMEAK